ncbi:MAG: MFS transporter [Thermomicrobia bacterium]|nr:MFS transporter [Thermomicrobia bacterium]
MVTRETRPTGRIYYGWVMLFALAFTQPTSWGILYYGFSVFLRPTQQETGWSTAAITGAFSVCLLTSGLAALFVGRWVDRHGTRALMTAGSIAATLLILAWAGVHRLPIYYLIWAAIGVVSATIFYEPAFAAIATWFVRYRSRALTIITFIGGFASVIYIPLIAWLIQQHGWRTALVILAMLLAVLTIPVHALLLRRRPEDLGLEPDGDPEPKTTAQQPAAMDRSLPAKVAIRTASFRWLTTAFCLTLFANIAVVVHLLPYLIDRGFSPSFAASAAGLIGIMALPGRLIFTPLGGRIPRRYVTAAIFLLQALAIVTLITLRSTVGVALFVILFGTGFGAITPARASLVAELYGRKEYGTISGIMMLMVTGVRSLAPVSAGLLLAAFGRYEPVFWILSLISLLGVGAVLLIETGRRPTALPDTAAQTS